MKRFFIFHFSFFIFHFSFSQNLVPNYSFETYSLCPNGAFQIDKATPWYDPTGGTSDYFNACGTGYANVPFGGTGGYQYARTGNAYTGLFGLNGFGDGGREYIQVQLVSPLIQDSCYMVEFYCNLWNNYGYTIKTLGAYLSNSAVSTTAGWVLQYTPQIVSKSFLTDTLNWMRVAGYYKANGGEKYITIGNFKNFSSGDTLYNGVGGYPGSAYLIDDVTVQKVVACDTTTNVEEYNINKLFRLFPNPNDGKMIFEYSLQEHSTGMFVLHDITGRVVNQYNLSIGENNSLTINENELNNGVYFYKVFINNKPISSDKLLIIK